MGDRGTVFLDGSGDDDVDEAYWTLCEDVRRNDSNVTGLNGNIAHFFPKGYGIHFGDALQGNTHVSSLWIRTDAVLPEDCDSIHCIQPLMDYIRTSSSLNNVELTYSARYPVQYAVASTVAGSCARAIAENASIETLELGTLPPVLDFHYLLSTTNSISTLVFHLDYSNGPDITDDEENIVAEAIGRNRSIEDITFGACLPSSLVGKILEQLRSRPCGLKNLSIYWETDPFEHGVALYKLLQSTPRLESLELRYLPLPTDAVQCLVNGLWHRLEKDSNRPAVLLKKLLFSYCDMQNEAGNLLIGFLQTRVQTSDSSSGVQSRLYELAIEDFGGDCLDSDSKVAASNVVSMLATQPETIGSSTVTGKDRYYETIGSQLHTLSIAFQSVALTNFFHQMTAEASRIRFSRLNLHYLRIEECHGLVQYLSNTLTLRKLSIGNLPYDVPFLWILKGLRENQSLHHVSVTGCFQRGFSESQLELVEAYCQRNRSMPYLLANPQRLDPPSRRREQATLDDRSKRPISSIYPTLLRVAMGTTSQRFALKNLSGSLSRLVDAVGPEEGNRKRQRTSL